ncbi:galactose-binding domain-like protein [Naematelia encephala]|uniref:Galactose-binding domain-like protein n=1 Tax=Naematelia encephala TaxID=71784 RepID=A0A1Y2AHP7_9TREE|nr:galactose-binding domain-like protein [Naematelia encephala]
MVDYKSIPLEVFDTKLRTRFTEVSSSAIGGQVIGCSDDFFASRHNLIKPSPSASLKGQFGPDGALYDGWESRRHNPTFDWVIILLAPPLSHLHYVDIDTSHFSGNEAPASQVFALRLDPPSTSTSSSVLDDVAQQSVKLSPNDKRWQEILPVVELGPNSRHIFELGSVAKAGVWSALMVRMIPDGGMARFRAFGHPLPPTPYTTIPPLSTPPINLLSAFVSARIVAASDANFSPPSNLLLPGRGFDMSDGWETRRSQEGKGKYAKGGALEGEERREWVVARLGGKGVLRWVEVDTAYHPGNYPVACSIEATLSDEDLPPPETKWTTIVVKKPLGSHRQHWFDVERSVPTDQIFSHVRYVVYPDGGTKRLRVFGYPIDSPPAQTLIPATSSTLTLPALPLTYEAFKPYGQVIQGFSLASSAPKGIHVNVANQGTAFKFHRLAKIEETYPQGSLKKGGLGIGLARAQPHFEISAGRQIPLNMLERHACTTQAFIPLSKGSNAASPEGLSSGGAYIVVVALNGKDDRPDLSTLRSFLATAAQGVSFDAGIWHHSLLTVDGPLDYACVEAQLGDGSLTDCEQVRPSTPMALIEVPPYTAVEPSSKPYLNGVNGHAPAQTTLDKLASLVPTSLSLSSGPIVPEPISESSFAPFGQLIRAHPDLSLTAHGELQSSPDGRTNKWTRLADITSTYPQDTGAVTGIAVFRATPKVGLERGQAFDVRFMERHPYTSQAFIPMGKAEWKGKSEEKLPKGGEMLVVVAKNGSDDRPDPSTIKAFIMPTNTGLNYHAGVWHHPTLILDAPIDLACVETQISTGIPEPDERDCELLSWEGQEVFGKVAVPSKPL